ncbi:hypothetical protein CsatB_012643 [Cannabis sativa]
MISSKRFEGKVAIVTGSTQGIGYSISHRLGLEGASVVVSSRNQKFGKIDVIVSSVAVNPITGKRITTIMGTQESILDKMWEVNIKAPILLMKEAAPHMKKCSIIFISSISAYVQPISGAMYGVTKTTLLGLTKALAFELGPEVRVNCVASGVVPTRFSEIITTSETLMKIVLDSSKLKRLGTPEEIAAAAVFLASDDASYITGETLVVAGGIPSRL